MFGTLIANCRTRARLSQKELAIRSGLSCSLISKLERNECDPNLVTLFALSKGLPVESRQSLATWLYQLMTLDQGPPVVGSRSGTE